MLSMEMTQILLASIIIQWFS